MRLDEDGNYYCQHVMAMTSEVLHSKSDIAAELGFRDQQIDILTKEVQCLKRQLQNYDERTMEDW